MTKAKRVSVSFLASERTPMEIVHRQPLEFKPAAKTPEGLDSVLNCILLLDAQRQIVFASRRMQEWILPRLREGCRGLRLGEALACIHATDSPEGCGNSKDCHHCGALLAVLASLAGKRVLREFRLTRFIGARKEAHRLLVLAVPLEHEGEVYSFVAFAEAGDVQLKQLVEKMIARTESKSA